MSRGLGDVYKRQHTDVALGEGNRQGGLWLTVGLEPEFPLWLGLISLPLTFLGDSRWFLPSLGLSPLSRGIPQCWGEVLRKGRLNGVQECPPISDAHRLSLPSAPVRGNRHAQCFPQVIAFNCTTCNHPSHSQWCFYPDLTNEGTEA